MVDNKNIIIVGLVLLGLYVVFEMGGLGLGSFVTGDTFEFDNITFDVDILREAERNLISTHNKATVDDTIKLYTYDKSDDYGYGCQTARDFETCSPFWHRSRSCVTSEDLTGAESLSIIWSGYLSGLTTRFTSRSATASLTIYVVDDIGNSKLLYSENVVAKQHIEGGVKVGGSESKTFSRSELTFLNRNDGNIKIVENNNLIDVSELSQLKLMFCAQSQCTGDGEPSTASATFNIESLSLTGLTPTTTTTTTLSVNETNTTTTTTQPPATSGGGGGGSPPPATTQPEDEEETTTGGGGFIVTGKDSPKDSSVGLLMLLALGGLGAYLYNKKKK